MTDTPNTPQDDDLDNPLLALLAAVRSETKPQHYLLLTLITALIADNPALAQKLRNALLHIASAAESEEDKRALSNALLAVNLAEKKGGITQDLTPDTAQTAQTDGNLH